MVGERRAPKRSTRKDVALRARTSTAVVSYVINGGPRPVAPATRDRVHAAIAELDYRPNGIARTLRARRSLVLGLVVPDASNPFFAQLARVVEDVAFSEGFKLLVGSASDNPARESSYLRAFGEQRIDGLLLMSVGGSSESVAEIKRLDSRVVVVDRLLPGVDAATLVADHKTGGYLATKHLLDHGHRSIACIIGPNDIAPSSDRRRGWARALREAKVRREPSWCVRRGFHQQGGYEAALELLKRETRPTAIFASTDVQAIGALRAAADLGLRVPQDVAVVSFDGIIGSRFTVPSLTTVAQPIEGLARRSMELLIKLVRDPSAETTHQVLPVELIIRESCGCATRSVAGGSPVPLAKGPCVTK